MTNDYERLQRIASSHGVELSYYDIDGTHHVASEEALRAVLRPLAGSDHPEPPSPRMLPTVTVFWEGAGVLPVRVPDGAAGRVLRLVVSLEDGTELTDERVASSLPPHEGHGGHGGQDVPAGSRRWLVPHTLPFGYHRVRIEDGDEVVSGWIFSAPERVFQGRVEPSWGVFAPTYALHSERSLGIGDVLDLERLAQWVGGRGGSTLATLPLSATFLRDPLDPSPYAPLSRLFFSELYLAVDALPEAERAPAAFHNALGRMREETRAGQGEDVDYRAVAVKKRELLEQLLEVAESTPATKAELDAWLERFPEAVSYARFVATWDRERPDGPTSAADAIGDESSWLPPSDPRVRYVAYVQWRLHEQLVAVAERVHEYGVGLYLDLPLGAHPDGYDAWRFRDSLLIGCGQGAPPDTIFAGGQDWGFSPLHPHRSSESGHEYFRRAVARQMELAEVLRIDHVMGLHRSYCVPSGFGATEGLYVRQPAEEYYAVLTIESHRHGTYVVGEDLGTVPDEVRAAMDRHGIGRLYVSQYEEGMAASGALPENCVASLNTHDMPTFATHYASEGGTEHGLEAALMAELRHLGASEARRVLASLEDFWFETRPQNLPGTSREAKNWSHRLQLSLSEIEEDERVRNGIVALARPTRRAIAAERVGPIEGAIDACRATADDLYLFNEGTHERLFDVLGSHVGECEGKRGVYFAVWAPNARSVSVIGSFNDWWPDRHALFPQGSSGVWACFVPGVRVGDVYKYRIVTREGAHLDKTDPFARRFEMPPRTASVVYADAFQWADEAWMAREGRHQRVGEPVSIYELHLGSWRRRPDGTWLTYMEIAPLLIEHVTKLGFTHVEFLPVMEHPYYPSWGYQTTGYFAPTARYGEPDGLKGLIDALHRAGIGVILDWVPGHFPSDDFSLARFDGSCLYEYADPRRGVHPDWKSLIFDYGRLEVRSFLISSAVFWIEHFHVDGLRVDGVASMLYLDYSRRPGEWIPNQHGGRENLEAMTLLRSLNETVYGRHPNVQTTAEESTSWPMVSRPTWVGGLGFGFKWDMGWMNDSLRYLHRDPVHRRFHQNELTFRPFYAWTENFVLPLSHDEVVHGKGSLLGKMPGDPWQKFANLRLLYAFMYAQPGHKLLFQGAEIAPWNEWAHDGALELDLLSWPTHRGIFDLLAELNGLYRDEPALHQLDFVPEGFEWVEWHNAAWSVIAFDRLASDGTRMLCVFNFTPVPRSEYRIGVNEPGTWRERLNTDATCFAGSGVGNEGAVQSQPIEAQGRPHSLALRLPPLGAIFLRSPEGENEGAA